MDAPDLQFKQLIDRILRCREAEDEAKDDTKEVYAELKALGYDKTAAGAFVAELRKKGKNLEQFEERNAILDLYRDAYERASHAHTREAATPSPDMGVGLAGPALAGSRPAANIKHAPNPPSPENAQATAEAAPKATEPAVSAPLSKADIPAFLRQEQPKSIADYRPHCKNPEACAASGLTHCYACRKAMETASETEAA